MTPSGRLNHRVGPNRDAPVNRLSAVVRSLLRRLRSRVRTTRASAWLRSHPSAASIIDRVLAEQLTYLEREALVDLARAAQRVRDKGIEGAIVEAGCALGGSAIVLAAVKEPRRELLVYDVFGLIPPPSDRDDADVHARYEEITAGRATGIGGARYYGYNDDLYTRVRTTFDDFGLPPGDCNTRLIPGLFEDTLKPPSSVALAHIDCDWHDSVMVCMERLWPVMQPGGIIVLDDYHAWSGCRRAVDSFLGSLNRSEFRIVKRTRLHIVKVRSGARQVSRIE
jgi:hypothetical protein